MTTLTKTPIDSIPKNTVVVIKLITGEEVITQLTDDYHSSYLDTCMKKPTTVVPDGQGGCVLIPWLLTKFDIKNDNEVYKIKNSNIIFVAKLDNSIANQYRAIISPIINASSGGLIT